MCRCSYPFALSRLVSLKSRAFIAFQTLDYDQSSLPSALAPPFPQLSSLTFAFLRTPTTTPPNPRPRRSPRWSIAKRTHPRGSSHSMLPVSFGFQALCPALKIDAELSFTGVLVTRAMLKISLRVCHHHLLPPEPVRRLHILTVMFVLVQPILFRPLSSTIPETISLLAIRAVG